MIIIAVLVVLSALLVVPGVLAGNMDTIYPNVSMNGTNLSRMTAEQARQALISAGYENNAEGISVSVQFPNGEIMVIDGAAAGLALNAEDAAAAAYEYGRAGNFIMNGFSLLKSFVSKTELSGDSISELDEDYVRGIVSEYTRSFNSALMDDAYIIEDDRIIITKGVGSALADENEVYDLTIETLHTAITEHKNLTVDYLLENNIKNEIDLVALFNTVNVEPVSAYYDNETKSVTESSPGVSFDMAAAQTMLNNAKSGEQIVIPLIITEPEITSEQLEALLFRDILSTKKTYIDGTSNRLNNVVVSAAAINGLVLNPGESFSFNDVVGKRTADRGYKEAGAYVGGRTVQEIGGGICQTSSTLYYCVLYANLEVTSRASHMFTVPYLPLGHDATINWGTIDFKFNNNTEYPIRLDLVTEGRYITVTIYGTKLDTNYVKTEYVVVSTTDYETIHKEDESVEAGKTVVDADGHTGYVVDLYKYIYDENNNQISKTHVSRSTYRVQDRVVLVPVGTLNTESPPPSESPSASPSDSSSASPSDSASSSSPSDSPSAAPSEAPSDTPTEAPSETASASPSETPSETPATPSPSDTQQPDLPQE